MGMLWDIIQKHIDEAQYPPSERQIARKLGVAPSVLTNWRELKRLPTRENLQAIADLVGVRYSVVLEAALRDTGYHEDSRPVSVLYPPRPVAQVEAELQAARITLQEWDELKQTSAAAESKRRELQARVEALNTELAASRNATTGTDSVAEL